MPLPAKEDGDGEERLILAQALGAAGRSLTLTWQRAGSDGRTRMPSLALREMARIIKGSPDPEALAWDGSRLPAALDRLAPALEARFGLASPREVRLHAALQAAEGDTARQALAGRHPDLAPGLEMLARLESFGTEAGPFDARIGDAAPLPAHLGVGSLERLGRCPARYFFQKVLGLPEEDVEARLSDLEARDMGRAVHSALESCWRAVLDGPAGLEDRKAAADRLQAELEALWPGLIARLLGRRQERLPVLWRRESERWRAAVAAFLARDPVAHLPEAFRGMEMEADLEGPWPGGGEGAPLLRGRFDRRVHGADREVHVDDYKTGGKLPDMASETEMLKLRRLQVPLYHLLSGGAGVRLLGVGPDFLPGGRREDDAEAVFTGFSSEAIAAAFRASLASALDLLRIGAYPMNPGTECGFCSFTRACRRLHPPSRERDAAAADAAGYRLAGTRSRTYPGGRR
jgi:RecB family exonuclease